MVNLQPEGATTNDEDVRSRVLDVLAQTNGGDGNTQELVKELLLSQMGDTDPRTADLISRFLDQSQTAPAQSSPPAAQEADLAYFHSPGDRSEERARAFQQLRQTMEHMYSELDGLRERNHTLASALGACYLCWGEDLDCPTCGGAGGPGSSMPDRSLLGQLVVPAMQRLRERKDVAARRAPDTEPQT